MSQLSTKNPFGDEPAEEVNPFGDSPAGENPFGDTPAQPPSFSPSRVTLSPLDQARQASSQDLKRAFEGQSLKGFGEGVKSITPEEFESGRPPTGGQHATTAKEAFTAGVYTSALRAGRGLGTIVGARDFVSEVESELSGWQPLVRGIPGVAGQIIGTAPVLGAGTAGVAGSVALAAVGVSGFGNRLADIKNYEDQNELALPTRDKILLAAGQAALDMTVTKLGTKVLVKKVAPGVVRELGQAMVNRNYAKVFTSATKALGAEVAVKSAEGALLMGAYQTAGNMLTKYGYDKEQDLTEGVTDSALFGAAFAVAGAPLSLAYKARMSKLRAGLEKEYLITPEESKIIGDDLNKLREVALQRKAGNLVTVTGEGISTTPDVLTWEMKKALGHNEPVLKLARDEIKAGRLKPEDIFLPQETGPVRPEELAQVQGQLKKLTDEINLDTTREYDTSISDENPIPLTKRALLQGDIDLLQSRLASDWDKPQGRQLVDQARGLMESARRRGIVNDTSPLPPMPGLIGKRAEVLTPLELVPRDKLKLKVELAKASGYLQSADKLTDNVRLRQRIASRQVQFLKQVFALRRGTSLPAVEAFKLSKALEAEFVGKVERILAKDDNSPTGARAQVMRAAKENKKLVEADVDLLGKALDVVSERTVNMTQRETVANLLEDLYEAKAPEHVLQMVEGLYGKMTTDVNYQPWSDRVRQGLAQVKQVNEAIAGGVRKLESDQALRQDIQKLVETLPPEYRAPLLDETIKAQSTKELQDIVKRIGETQEKFLRDTQTNNLVLQAKRLEKNSQRSAGLERLKKSFVEVVGDADFSDNPNVAPWVNEALKLQGKNPNRLLNEIDANRPKTVKQLANDPLTKYYEAIGNKTMADRMRKGDLSGDEYAAGLKEMRKDAPGDDTPLARIGYDVVGPGSKVKLRTAPASKGSIANGVRVGDRVRLDGNPGQVTEVLMNKDGTLAEVQFVAPGSSDAPFRVTGASFEEMLKRKKGFEWTPSLRLAPGDVSKETQDFYKQAKPPTRLSKILSLLDTVGEAEKKRYRAAKSFSEFAAISPEHALLGQRLAKLKKDNALLDNDLVLLRYIFSAIPRESLAHIETISSWDFADRKWSVTEPMTGKQHVIAKQTGYGAYWQRNIGLRQLGLERLESGNWKTFVHEYLHSAYWGFLDVKFNEEFKALHAKLLSEPSKLGLKSKAHDIILYAQRESRQLNKTKQYAGTQKQLDYYANSPGEFFAEVGVGYLLKKVTPPSSVRLILDSLYSVMRKQVQRLLKTSAADKLLPKEYLEGWDRILEGKASDIPTLEDMRESGATWQEWPYEDKETSQPIFTRSKKTGKEEIDIRALRTRSKDLSIDELTSLNKDLTRIVRKGQLERGLYNKWLKFSSAEDAAGATAALSKFEDRSQLSQSLDIPKHVAKYVYDPVSTEGWLYQLSRGDTENIIYKTFVKNFIEPYSRSQAHSASSRRYIRQVAKELYGWAPDKARDEWRFVKHMTEELKNGIQRGEAMWAYALTTDKGRVEAVKQDGIMARGKKFELDESIGLLSKKDREFVDRTKSFLLNNPFIEKAFKDFTLLNGYEAERSPGGYFTSRRQLEPVRQPEDFNDYELHLIRSVDALKARTEDAGQPFKLDGGFVSAFYQVSDQLATYSEMGRDLHRAGKLLVNQEFRDAFVAKFGESRFKDLESYWQNKMGVLGQNPSGLDTTISYFVHARVASRIGFNLWSAMKQSFAIFTALGDDVLSSGSLLQAMAEGSIANEKLGKEMKQYSGIASMRLQGGRFAENIMVLGHRKVSPKLALIQDKAFVLQKFMDERTLRLFYRAAQLDAKKQGLTGRAAREYTVDRFETALTRGQTSDSPIYSSEMELLAKRNKTILSSLAFKRELNRVYNTTRHHVVLAAQNPTKQNIAKAGNALFWMGIVNPTAEVGVNALRLMVYGLPAWGAAQFAGEQIKSLAGNWYLSGDVVSFFEGFFDKGEQSVNERDLGLLPSALLEAKKMGWAVADIIGNANLEEGESEDFTRGAKRGVSKQMDAVERATSTAISVASSALGIPMWALYQQGKGLYNWKREDWRLLVHLEAEYQKLKKNPEKYEYELGEIQRIKDRINKTHRMREKGLLTKEEAREEIISELKQR